ncbi:hypothetical protein ACHAWF_011464, partial [Thalassiosira exigua]
MHPPRLGRRPPLPSSRACFLLLIQAALFAFLGSTCQLAAIHRLEFDGGGASLGVPPPPPRGSGRGRVEPSEESAPPLLPPARPVVAYAVTLTGCGNDSKRRYTPEMASGLIAQGAAVLRHSIRLAHVDSKYDFETYALVHPSAANCSRSLEEAGYTVLVRGTPFDKADVRGAFLREHVDGASCCGAKEYVKLYAYTLGRHPLAVILDLDSLVLKPLDGLFDALLEENYDWTKSTVPLHDQANVNVTELNERSERGGESGKGTMSAFYTRDYNMVNPGHEAGVQGGFLIVRPDEEVFAEYIDLVLTGDFREGSGWGGQVGYFFGGMQIQGICGYYYRVLRPESGVELDRCRVNAMVDNPYYHEVEGSEGDCRDGREACEDCRATDLSEVLSAHFTVCQKPWECAAGGGDLCAELHGEWFRVRRSFEESRARNDPRRKVPEVGPDERGIRGLTRGYCSR